MEVSWQVFLPPEIPQKTSDSFSVQQNAPLENETMHTAVFISIRTCNYFITCAYILPSS